MPYKSLLLLQKSTAFGSEAPLGTGLEWMTIGAVILPALLLIVLVYLGRQTVV